MSFGLAALKRPRAWIAAGGIAFAAYLVHRALRPYSTEEIVASLADISAEQIALGVMFTAFSFLALSLSDTLAVRYTGAELPYRRILLASFTSVSIGHTLGFAALSSGALRYRFYTAWGLSQGDVGRIMLFCAVTVALGMMSVSGIASILRPDLLAQLFRVGERPAIVLGSSLLLGVAVYLSLAAFVRRPVRVLRFRLPVPRLSLALGQIAVGSADILLVSAVLHQMLSADAEHYPAIVAAYVTANLAGVIVHVPGGLGVIEAVIVSLIRGAHVVGALIAFRAVYYLLPFAVGCLTLAAAELARRGAGRGEGG